MPLTIPAAAGWCWRTERGLEVGEVLVPPPGDHPGSPESDGSILRGLTVEDELLLARLAKNREAAFVACQSRIDQLDLPVTLMDVEHLFDGQTLVFYFLGSQPPELSRSPHELAEALRRPSAVPVVCGGGDRPAAARAAAPTKRPAAARAPRVARRIARASVR